VVLVRAHKDPVNTNSSTFVDYLRLFRIPNVFTALADVTMGFLFMHRALQPVGVYVCLAAASALIYTAGMVLNDVWDADQDRADRPHRPIPSGRIAQAQARRIGFGLLVSGVILGWMAGSLGLVDEAPWWRSGAVATLLALCVLLYDGVLKRTLLGPLTMGMCRLLNVLLGMSVAVAVTGPAALAGFGSQHWLAAGGIGLYIVGVTWLARTEAKTSSRWSLAAATLVMMTGIAGLGAIHQKLPVDFDPMLEPEIWYLLLGLLAFTIVRRCSMAVADPSPANVQLAVKNSVWSLIVLDAAVALLVSPAQWALVVLSLIIPTVVLGQWIEST
jgi:4-hydroxybenzoate polyprenyltransferase